MEPFFLELKQIFKEHGRIAARHDKTISIATYAARRAYLARELYRLRTGKLLKMENGKLVPERRFEIPSPYGLKRKHVEALIADWLARDLSTAYLHNLLSMLRVFAGWIGKPDLVPATAEIVPDPKHKRRQQVATRDLSWSGAGVDVAEKLRDIAAADRHVAMVLDLMRVYALRLKEASLLRPHLADQFVYLDIGRGTKGGRDRMHKITTPEEREVLDRAKALVQDRAACLIPRGTSYRSWQNHVYYILKKHGVTHKAIGTSSHGLRHEGLNDLYQKITGAPSPVRGGKPGEVDPETDRFARAQVAETAGHSRPRISSAYLGGVLRRQKHHGEIPNPPPTAESTHGNADAQPLAAADGERTSLAEELS
jgi:hypothetical protein